jgi:hypothetical protein
MCAEKIPIVSLMMPYFDCIERKHYNFQKRWFEKEDADTTGDGTEAAYDKMMKYFDVASDSAVVAISLKHDWPYFGIDADLCLRDWLKQNDYNFEEELANEMDAIDLED